MNKISVSIVTWNEEKNIERALKSVQSFADEVVVVDMSTDVNDRTATIAKKLKAKVYEYKYTGLVEPARNFSISKTTGEWVLVLDADEEIPHSLANKLKGLVNSEASFYEIPRKNIVFGKVLLHSRWWPDYQIRFFKKGSVKWSDKIHEPPQTTGAGSKLEASEENAITHHHYESISQFLTRLNRYTDHQLIRLQSTDYHFAWADLVKKPTQEFLSRFYFGKGYLDGVHGLALALLQSFSELVLYLKAWEDSKFPDDPGPNFKTQVEQEISQSVGDWKHWVTQSSGFLKKIKFKLKL